MMRSFRSQVRHDVVCTVVEYCAEETIRWLVNLQGHRVETELETVEEPHRDGHWMRTTFAKELDLSYRMAQNQKSSQANTSKWFYARLLSNSNSVRLRTKLTGVLPNMHKCEQLEIVSTVLSRGMPFEIWF